LNWLPPLSPDRGLALCNRGLFLMAKFGRVKETSPVVAMKYLDKAIESAREATRITPFSDPRRPGILDKAGAWLGTGFKLKKNLEIVIEAIEYSEEAPRLTLKEDLKQSSILSSLAMRSFVAKMLSSRLEKATPNS
jgi:hypothetical protein